MNVGGHVWTIGTLLRRMARPAKAPPSQPWTTTAADPVVGSVRLTGWLSVPARARHLVVLVHGLGGSSESTYLTQAAREAWHLGIASLRLNLRGADGQTADFYHGGLTDDLAVAVKDLAPRFERLSVLGFSLGGHIALRFATEVDEPSVAAAAAICSPLDLAAGVEAIDGRAMAVYRWYVLRNLKRGLSPRALARIDVSPAALLRVKLLREWDSLTVVPRFGFRDTDDYYARASVGPLLAELRLPALLVAAEHDPMIPPRAIRPQLDRADAAGLTVRWLARGGHVAWPSYVELGLGPIRGNGCIAQMLRWLESVW